MPAQAITQFCPQCQMALVLPVTYAGRKVPCSRCGTEVLIQLPVASPLPPARAVSQAPVVLPPHLAGANVVPEPNAPVPGSQGHRPPHLQGTAAGNETALPFPKSADGHRVRRKTRSWLGTAMLTLGVAALASTLILGIVILAAWWGELNTAEDDGSGEEPPEVAAAKIDKSQYTNAQKKSASVAGMLVRIDRVAVGKVHYRSKGEIFETSTPNYLMITLNIKNKSHTDPVEYQSWYTFEFEDEGDDGPQPMKLIDENGVEIEIFPIPGADSVERHVVSSTKLETGDDAYDTLVFKLDPEYLENPVPSLYLTLPAAAVGQPGTFRFHIPGAMVQRRE